MDAEKIDALIDCLQRIRDFPPKGYPRRTKDGYPDELAYDEFAYKRMVDTFRETARIGLARAGKKNAKRIAASEAIRRA